MHGDLGGLHVRHRSLLGRATLPVLHEPAGVEPEALRPPAVPRGGHDRPVDVLPAPHLEEVARQSEEMTEQITHRPPLAPRGLVEVGRVQGRQGDARLAERATEDDSRDAAAHHAPTVARPGTPRQELSGR